MRTSLVDEGVVDEFRVWVENLRGFGLLIIEATMPPVTSMDAVDSAIRGELREIRTKGVSVNQLEAARNTELSRQYSEFYDRSTMARRFGEAFALSLDPLRYPKLISEIRTVSAGDVWRIVEHYLSMNNSVTLSWMLEDTPLWIYIVAVVIVVSVPIGILLVVIWVVKTVIRKYSRGPMADEQDSENLP